MNRNRMKPKHILILALIFVLSLVIAFTLRRFLPDSIERFKNLITWAIVVVIVCVGGFFAGRFMRGGRR